MGVNIAPGSVAIPAANNTGAVMCVSDAVETLTLDPAPPSGQSRTDLIICQAHGADLDGGSVNDFVFDKVTGTPALAGADEPEARPRAVPVTPAGAVPLAYVNVPGGAATFDYTKVGDRRQPVPNAGARYWRNAAYTVPYSPAYVGAWFDRRTFDAFSGQPGGSAAAPGDIYNIGSDLITLPAAGVWRIHYQLVHNTNNTWASAQLYLNPTGGPGTGARIAFSSVASPMNTWVHAIAERTSRFAAGDRVQCVQQISGGPANGVPGDANVFVDIIYIEP
jgi:hypothetical protein